MKSFKELEIKPTTQNFTGEKIKMDKVLNKPITVFDFRMMESKYKEKGNGKCLHLQIEFNNEKRVLFTGSGILMDMIGQIKREDLPFTTTIVKESDRLEFT